MGDGQRAVACRESAALLSGEGVNTPTLALMNTLRLVPYVLVFALAVTPLTASAQQVADASAPAGALPSAMETPATPDAAEVPGTVAFPNQRPPDTRGLNVFEPPKSDADRLGSDVPRLRIGAGFTQSFQDLHHSNTALANMVPNTATPAPGDSLNLNGLIDIGAGFNTASANLTVDALLADGVHVNVITYLSSRHHNEAWVKGGYIQVDAAHFLGSPLVDELFRYLTLRVGHYEVDYGDAHYRRTDNGNALYNPFAENYIMDAFATEIGGDALIRYGDVLAMVGVTGGEIKGDVTSPSGRSVSVLGKVGVDRQLTPALRLRLTGSGYHNGNAAGNTLYGGDRAGSSYFYVLENTQATTTAQAFSGRINPGFRERVTALQLNPFVKFHGLELFGVLERAMGRAANEAEGIGRAWTQVAADAVYRFLPREQAYVGARINVASGPLAGPAVNGAVTTAGADVSVRRVALAAGWFPTRNILLKTEYVRQDYSGFPAADIRDGGEFHGFVVEGVVSF